MSNVIKLNVPSQRQSQAARRSALIASFATHRRFGDDVFWLKENAELLNIMECTGARLETDALAPHEGFYAQVEKRLGFFHNTTGFFCRSAWISRIWGWTAPKPKPCATGLPVKGWLTAKCRISSGPRPVV